MAAVNMMNPCTLLLLLLVVMESSSVSATDHNVGGSSNWDLGVDYTSWASANTFAVGDNLVFTWTGNHDVVEVTSSDYSACTTSSSSDTKYSTSPVTLALASAGTKYYLCSVTGHCNSGMKLQVTVAAAASSSSSSSGSTNSSSSPSPSSSSPSSGTNSSSATSSGTNSSSAGDSTTPNSSPRLLMLPPVFVALALSLAAAYSSF